MKSTKEAVIKGRDKAGRVMLTQIFTLLTTWNEQNVDKFPILLNQFIHAYNNPVLQDGKELWELPYGLEKVNIKSFILQQYTQHKMYLRII